MSVFGTIAIDIFCVSVMRVSQFIGGPLTECLVYVELRASVPVLSVYAPELPPHRRRLLHRDRTGLHHAPVP